MRRIWAAVGCAVLAMGTGVEAAVYSFGDSTYHWEGWGNGRKDTTDSIGIPDFGIGGGAAGQVVVEAGRLQSVTFFYSSYYPAHASLSRSLLYGDLFLDIGGTGEWDYVVRQPGTYGRTAVDGILDAGAALSVFHFPEGIGLADAEAYQLSNESKRRDGSPWPSNWVIRDDHPWVLNSDYLDHGTELAGSVLFSGWMDNALLGWSTFDFSAVDLPIPDGLLTIGFTMNCANDVLYETIAHASPTVDHLPEPASLVVWSLLALTVSGMGSWVRRRGRKSTR